MVLKAMVMSALMVSAYLSGSGEPSEGTGFDFGIPTFAIPNASFNLDDLLITNPTNSGSAGSAASAAGEASLTGSGGVQGLMEQQSACVVPEKSERPWEFATGKNPSSLAFSPDGRLLAVANQDSGNVSMYQVDVAKGVLQQTKGSPFTVIEDPVSVAFSPDGGSLAVASFFELKIFENNQGVLGRSQGSLFKASFRMFNASFRISAFSFSPNSRLLAITNFDQKRNGTLSIFSADNKANFMKIEDVATGKSPSSVHFSSNGKMVAVANSSSDTISLFSATNQGSLTPVQGSPFKVGGLVESDSWFDVSIESPIEAIFSPSSRFLAVALHGRQGKVAMFSINDQGMVIPVQESPFTVGVNPIKLSFSPDGKLLVMIHQATDIISLFSVGDNGRLARVQGLPFRAGQKPSSVAFSPDGKLLAVTNAGHNTVWMYEVDPDTRTISPITGDELKATKREKEYQEARKVLVEPIPPILPKAVVENVLQEFIVGPQPGKKQEKQDKEPKESDDVIQQKIKRTQEQEASRKEDQEKLFEAIKKGDEKGVAEYLTPFTINATNEKDEFRGTPLLAATRLNKAAIVKKILDYEGEIVRADKVPYSSKANLMAKDKDGNTALLSAIFNHDDYKIALTIAEKMTPEEREKPIRDGASAIVYVERFQKKAANKADYEKLKALLQK